MITLRRRQLRRRGAALAAGVVLTLAATACDRPGETDATAGTPVDRGEPTTSIPATDTDTETTATEGADGDGSQLESTANEAASDLERRVVETLSELDAQVRGGDTVITLPDRVLFEFDKSELLPGADSTLDDLAEAIVFFADAPVRVEGHTDSKGSPAYNQELSERRAQAVVDYLVAAGVGAERVTAQGFGETKPVALNTSDDGSDNPEGRARNRRVEIVIQGADPAQIGD